MLPRMSSAKEMHYHVRQWRNSQHCLRLCSYLKTGPRRRARARLGPRRYPSSPRGPSCPTDSVTAGLSGHLQSTLFKMDAE